jgi:iron complex outermembrane recepter protein
MAYTDLRSLVCVGVVLTIDLSATARAQSLEEVVVTARRVEERLQDVPISITVYNQQQLADRDITSASDLATYTPSLTADKRFGSDTASFAIRGFTQELRTAASVAVYFADVVAPRGGNVGTGGGDGSGPGSYFDLQNVQVLKGPQGTLFGRNTTGGAILLVPKKPDAEVGGYVEASLGNYDMKRIQGVLNLALNDSVRMRFGVDTQKRDGYENNISGIGPDKFGDIDYLAARASLVVDLAPNLENYTIGTFTRSDDNGTLDQIFACNPTSALGGLLACPQISRQQGLGFYAVQNALPDATSWSTQWQAINTTTWHASDSLTAKNIISYSQYRSVERQEVFGSRFLVPSFIPGLGGLPIGFAATNPLPGGYTSDQSTFTEEVQFQGTAANDRLQWQGGGYFESSKPLSLVGSRVSQFMNCTDLDNLHCLDVLGILAGAPGFGGSATDNFGDVSYRNQGVYAQTTYNLTDRLKLTTGLRYTWDHSGGDGELINYRFPNPANTAQYIATCSDATAVLTNNCKLFFADSSSAPTWLVGLDRQMNDDVMLYGKYARGYRQGSVNAFGPPGYNTFNPEKVDSYELGAKTAFQGAVSGIFNVAAFYNNLRDQQLQAGFQSSTNAAPQTTGIVNAGKSRIWGVEVEASLVPWEPLRFDVNYTYLNTKLQTEQPLVAAPGSAYDLFTFTSLAGDPLPFSPRNKASVTATYQLPVPDTIGRISLGITDTYSSSYLTAALSPYGVVGKSNLVNLNLNWTDVGGATLDLSAFVTNLTDDQYSTFTIGTYETLGFESRAIGEPRMFGVRARWRFGGGKAR